MLALALVAHTFAADARLVWRGGVGRVEIDAPGEHVAPEAPTTVQVGDVRVDLRGDPSALRFPVVPGDTTAEIALVLCTDGSTSCRPVRFGGAGFVDRSGSFVLLEGGSATITPVPAAPHPPSSAGVPTTPPAAPASPGAPTTTAGDSGVVKVLDFGAVWCPPCNLMAAEVLHDPAGAAGLPVEAIDVDRAESWPLKDRYAVGGYPTLVAVDADGREVDRLVGYPGAAETRAWFARLRAVVPLDVLAADVLDADGSSLTGDAAAAAARRLAEGERPDAARALFVKASDTVDLHVARLLVEPSEADARWLFEHDAPPGDWVFAAVDAAPALWPEATLLAPTVSPARGADFLYVAATHAPEEMRPALYASSLALLRAALTGNPEADRGHATFHADLLVKTGSLDAALALLDDHAARWPDEFTFSHAAARHLLAAGRLPEAEARARAALGKAWGDQRLRAAATLARVLAARGQRPEGVLVIDLALREQPAPPAGVEVRTTRYRKELEALRAELTAAKAAK